MGAIGNVLSGISIYTSPLIPSIPLGVIQISLALDLSHLATFIGALVGGPIIGAGTGFVGGAIAAYQFGFSQGNLITGFGLPIGKAITGVIAGLLISKFNFLKQDRNPFFFILITLIAYIPEAIYTAFLFVVVFPAVFGLPLSVVYLITTQILVKAFFEMVIMGIICGVLLSNQGFLRFTRGVFPKGDT
jgi:LytS/YehU family sensor histidine kinase